MATVAEKLAYAGEVYAAGVKPREKTSLKPSNEPGTDNRPEQQQLVPVQQENDGTLDDLGEYPD